MRETEITVQVFDDLSSIKQKLAGLGFSVVRHVIMSDHYYSKLDSEILIKKEYGEIMRNSFLVRSFSGDTNKVLLHYKDKELDESGNVISEEKLTELLTSEETAVKIFNSAKLNNWCNIVQEMFIYNGHNMEFAVQIVDGLGTFIEYEEDESVAGLAPEQKIKAMLNTLQGFGLSLGEDYSVKKVYQKFLNEFSLERD